MQSRMSLDQIGDASVVNSNVSNIPEVASSDGERQSPFPIPDPPVGNSSTPSDENLVHNVAPEQINLGIENGENIPNFNETLEEKHMNSNEELAIQNTDTTYQSLLKSYNSANRSFQNQENLEEVIKRFSSNTPMETSSTSLDNEDEQVGSIVISIIFFKFNQTLFQVYELIL